ncbi:MAG TPA: hypothetical protein EYG73_12855 [Arcobacter sp.]|nr:hypothetical protein [Arcobacter sp.]
MLPIIAGLSLGTVSLVGGAILVATGIGTVYYLSNSKSKEKEKSINKLLSDEDRYNGDKSIIEDAINEKDWETLEDMLESSTSDFPDLINMINNALKNR